MPAYNRVTQQFQNGFDLDASDLNAFRADLRLWFQQQTAAGLIAPSTPSTPSTPTNALTWGGTTLTWGASTLTWGP